MPITRSAHNALRQSRRRWTRNVREKQIIKSAIKEFRHLVNEKKGAEAERQLAIVYQKLDKAAKTQVIKKNKADRLKSRFAHRLGLSSDSARTK